MHRPFIEFLTPDSVQILHEYYQRFINVLEKVEGYSGGSTFHIEMSCKDGTTIGMEIFIDLIYNESLMKIRGSSLSVDLGRIQDWDCFSYVRFYH